MKDKQYKDAWQTFKEERTKEYIKLYRTVNQVIKPEWQYQVHQVANAMISKNDLAHILKEMDKLDGTKQFSNLLNDMGDE